MNAALQALSNWWDPHQLLWHFQCSLQYIFMFLASHWPHFYTSFVFSRSLWLFYSLPVSCLLWEMTTAVFFRENDDWVRIGAVHHSIRQKWPFVVPCRLFCYKSTPTLSPSLLVLLLLSSFPLAPSLLLFHSGPLLLSRLTRLYDFNLCFFCCLHTQNKFPFF